MAPAWQGGDDLLAIGRVHHVFGVSFAVSPRALMNVRVRSGPYKWHALYALRSERGVPSSFSSVCHHLTLPSPFRSGRAGPEVHCVTLGLPGFACSQHCPDGPRHAVGQGDRHHFEWFRPDQATQPVAARVGALAGGDYPHRPEVEQPPDTAIRLPALSALQRGGAAADPLSAEAR